MPENPANDVLVCSRVVGKPEVAEKVRAIPPTAGAVSSQQIAIHSASSSGTEDMYGSGCYIVEKGGKNSGDVCLWADISFINNGYYISSIGIKDGEDKAAAAQALLNHMRDQWPLKEAMVILPNHHSLQPLFRDNGFKPTSTETLNTPYIYSPNELTCVTTGASSGKKLEILRDKLNAMTNTTWEIFEKKTTLKGTFEWEECPEPGDEPWKEGKFALRTHAHVRDEEVVKKLFIDMDNDADPICNGSENTVEIRPSPDGVDEMLSKPYIKNQLAHHFSLPLTFRHQTYSYTDNECESIWNKIGRLKLRLIQSTGNEWNLYEKGQDGEMEVYSFNTKNTSIPSRDLRLERLLDKHPPKLFLAAAAPVKNPRSLKELMDDLCDGSYNYENDPDCPPNMVRLPLSRAMLTSALATTFKDAEYANDLMEENVRPLTVQDAEAALKLTPITRPRNSWKDATTLSTAIDQGFIKRTGVEKPNHDYINRYLASDSPETDTMDLCAYVNKTWTVKGLPPLLELQDIHVADVQNCVGQLQEMCQAVQRAYPDSRLKIQFAPEHQNLAEKLAELMNGKLNESLLMIPPAQEQRRHGGRSER